LRGVGRRCRFYWRFFRLYWRPIFQKKPWFSIKFIEFPGGGSGPKHSAFCGACFSINLYRAQKWSKAIKSDPKNHEPSVFFNGDFWHFWTKIWRFFNLSLPRFFNLIFFRRNKSKHKLSMGHFIKYFRTNLLIINFFKNAIGINLSRPNFRKYYFNRKLWWQIFKPKL
jgi:hypothetical protein